MNHSNPRGRHRFWMAGASLTVVAALSMAAISLHSESVAAKASAQAPQATAVSVAAVVRDDVATWNEFSGRLEAVERVDIRSRVAGMVQAEQRPRWHAF